MDCLEKVNKIVGKLVDRVAAYGWYTCMPQLVSRISHRHSDVFVLLECIIVKVLVTYAPQALWSMMALHHSRLPVRKKRAMAIFRQVKESSSSLHELLTQAEDLCNLLLDLSEHPTSMFLLSTWLYSVSNGGNIICTLVTYAW